MHEVFSEITPEPVAAASLGQVGAARMRAAGGPLQGPDAPQLDEAGPRKHGAVAAVPDAAMAAVLAGRRGAGCQLALTQFHTWGHHRGVLRLLA